MSAPILNPTMGKNESETVVKAEEERRDGSPGTSNDKAMGHGAPEMITMEGGTTVEEIEESKKGWFAYFQTRDFYIVLILGYVYDLMILWGVPDVACMHVGSLNKYTSISICSLFYLIRIRRRLISWKDRFCLCVLPLQTPFPPCLSIKEPRYRLFKHCSTTFYLMSSIRLIPSTATVLRDGVILS